MLDNLAIIKNQEPELQIVPCENNQGNIRRLKPPPDWLSGGSVNEVEFCEEFLKENPMLYTGKAFFTMDGCISDEDQIKAAIYEKLKQHITSGIANKVTNLMNVLRLACRKEELPLHEDRIHVANGTLYLDGRFVEEKQFCQNRLPVAYNRQAAYPWKWHNFLHQLLDPEDVLTLQEYMGYCMIPSNRAQSLLLITGNGGEGKSRVGIVTQKLFGGSMKNGNLAKVETNAFARADLEHMLVMVDDDMKMEALRSTNYIKTIVTAEGPVDLEKKGVQSYQGFLRVRFIVFGNGSLEALNDRSYAFFRRQIHLSAREQDPDRVTDPYLADKMCEEIEGILLWAFEGLQRLAANNYGFTLSEKTRANMELDEANSNNILGFMESDGYFLPDPKGQASSKEFYDVYWLWCSDNAVGALSAKAFSSFLRQKAEKYKIEYTNKIHMNDGRLVRGFTGVTLLHRPE